MKNYWSKNAAIALLIVSNTAMAAYIANQKFNIKGRMSRLFSHHRRGSQSVGVPQGEVSAAEFSDHDRDLQECYKSLLERQSQVDHSADQSDARTFNQTASQTVDQGVVQVHLTIDRTGKVHNLKLIRSDFSDSKFQSCLMDGIRTARVQVTPERLGVVISHRFIFKRRQVAQLNFDRTKKPE